MHECLDDSQLLPVSLRELPDGPVGHDAEPLAELGSEPLVNSATQSREGVELLLACQAVREAKVAGEVADVLVRLHRSPPRVDPEHGRPAAGRADEPEQQPDRCALAGAVRPQVPEHLSLLDAQVEVADGDDGVVVGLRETEGLDRRATGHASLSYFRTVG